MAVDTRDRRASCIGFVAPWRAVWPNPDGSLASQADRQHVAYSYPGIAASAAATVGGAVRATAGGSSRVAGTASGTNRIAATPGVT